MPSSAIKGPESIHDGQAVTATHPARFDAEQYRDHLADEVGALVTLAADADLAAPVPTCPDWNVARLLEHVGGVHRWAAEIVRRRSSVPVRFRELDLRHPDDAAGLARWLTAGGEELGRVLADADPDTEVWSWGPDHRVRFWCRRVVFETAVHRFDLAAALNEPFTLATDLAADGIDELLDNLPAAAAFAPHIGELRGDGEQLHFHASDTDGEWMITFRPDGFEWDHGHGKGAVAARGAAVDLLLLLYRRVTVDERPVECFGERDLLDRWLAHTAL